MLFAFLLFGLYFVLGILAMLAIWIVKIRFRGAAGLDPDSFLVKAFSKKSIGAIELRNTTSHSNPGLVYVASRRFNGRKHDSPDWGWLLEVNLRDRELGKGKIINEIRKAFEESKDPLTAEVPPKFVN